MNDLTLKNPVRTARIKAVRKENYRVKTIEMDLSLDMAQPGQFIMVWVPGIGERPMSIGDRKPLTISVADVGKVTSVICNLKEGDSIQKPKTRKRAPELRNRFFASEAGTG